MARTIHLPGDQMKGAALASRRQSGGMPRPEAVLPCLLHNLWSWCKIGNFVTVQLPKIPAPNMSLVSASLSKRQESGVRPGFSISWTRACSRSTHNVGRRALPSRAEVCKREIHRLNAAVHSWGSRRAKSWERSAHPPRGAISARVSGQPPKTSPALAATATN